MRPDVSNATRGAPIVTEMFRVIHIYKDYAPVRGGIESHIGLLARLSVEHGVPTTALCARHAGMPAHDVVDGVSVQRCTSAVTLASTPLPPWLPVVLWRARADLVHLHYPWPPAEFAYLLGGKRRPLVITFHCEVTRYPLLARALDRCTQRVFSAAQLILVSSAALCEAAVLARHRQRVQVVPFGVDIKSFRPDANAADPLPEIPRPRILFVGRLRHYKGLPVIAAALARLPEAQLIVVGNGPERARFEDELRVHQCRERVHFAGEVDDGELLRLYQTADAAVLASTSRAEAFGLSIAEAQSCGVPSVTTRVGTGTDDTVADGISGRVVPPNDPQALAEALRWCLDPAQAASRSAAARLHAETRLSGETMMGRVHAIYREVLERR